MFRTLTKVIVRIELYRKDKMLINFIFRESNSIIYKCILHRI